MEGKMRELYVKKRARQVFRRITSIILIIVITVGIIPQSVFAQERDYEEETNKIYTSNNCTIEYKETSSWDNYANVEVTITNNGNETIDKWQLSYKYEAQIAKIWNAEVVSENEGTYIMAGKTYNQSIAKNQSISFGFTACGENGKPGKPEEICITGEKERQDSSKNNEKEDNREQEDQESGEQDNTNNEMIHIFPEKWVGLEYAIFTSTTKNLSLYTNQTYINGDIHTNGSFCYQGTSLQVNGTIEAAQKITANTSSMDGALKVTKKEEGSKIIEMPDITSEVSSYARENGTVYEQKNKTFSSDSITIDSPILIEGSANFNATRFLGKGIVYAKNSISYNVDQFATPEESRIFLCSENGDITLNGSELSMDAVLYAPNGSVNVNANNFKLNGRIIAKSVQINGTTIKINAGEHDFDMIDFLFKPEVEIKVEGNQKENRKLTLGVEEIRNTQYLVKEDTEWKILKDGIEAKNSFVEKDGETNPFQKEIIFKEAGTYTVQVTVTTGKLECTTEKEIVIQSDLEPVASFELEKKEFGRDDNGIAAVTIKDTSYSPDNDEIGRRVWIVYYDANSNGIYEETEAEIISDANEKEVSYKTRKPGKYKVELKVTEIFSDTIADLLEDEIYLSDDTKDNSEEVTTFEIVNEAPKAKLDIEKANSADIVFTVGKMDSETIDHYSKKIDELKEAFEKQGIDTRVSTVSSSKLTAQSTFAWSEYDHYNYSDRYLPTLEKHIIYDENDIKMLGYSQRPIKDFLYVEDENAGQKIFEFDLQRDKTDWHSMEGGGFLFNTTISDEKNSINGFCILVSQSGLKLVQINCNNLNAFRNGSYTYVQNAGKLLRTFSLSNLYENHHFKIVTDKNTISVWDGDKLIVDNYVLPENEYGYGYGPIISHSSHSCRQQSYFTFKNITMQTVMGATLSDIVNKYEWREGSSHHVIHLSNDGVPELKSQEDTGLLAKALLENEVTFVGMGNETNKDQYIGLLNATQLPGMFLPSEELTDSMDQVKEQIEQSVAAKDYTIQDYISTDDKVTYKGYYSDKENDPIYDQKWEYEYDPTIFGESTEEVTHITKELEDPITIFDTTGAYSIRLKVRDNPVEENEALDSYRQWSEEEQYSRLLIVQTRPIATVKSEVTKDSKDSTKCIAKATYSAQDPDHPSDSKKGIREERFYYKNILDESWTEGKLPNKLEIGNTYLVKYLVKDMEGTYSNPAVSVVTTSQLEQWKAVEDTTPPEVYIEVAKDTIKVGEELKIEGYAVDDNGVDSFELYIDGEKNLDTFGRVIFTGGSASVIPVKAIAKDIAGNVSQKEISITVEDTTDRVAPTIEVTSPTDNSKIGFDIQFVGSIQDDIKLKNYILQYKKDTEDTYTTFASGEEAIEKGVLGQLNVKDFDKGIYDILISAEDAQGNIAYYGMKLYIEVTDATKVSISAQITDMRFTEDKSAIDVYGTVKTEGELQEYIVSYEKDGGENIQINQGNQPIENGKLGSIPAETLEDGTYTVILFAKESTGVSVTSKATFNYVKGTTEEGEQQNPTISTEIITPTEEEEFTNQTFALNLSHTRIPVGNEVKGQVTLPRDANKESLKVTLNGEELTKEASFTFTSNKVEEITIIATVMMENGEEVSKKATCVFYNSEDVKAPFVEFIEPEADSVIHAPTEIVGTVYDETELASYQLEYRLEGEKEYHLIQEEKEEKIRETLGVFDPTMLLNGTYEVRLTAIDQGGNLVRVSRSYFVEGNLKVGNMFLGFTDLTAKLGGATISENRFYDSRNKSVGDFGYGWTLGVQGVTLTESEKLYSGYHQVQVGSLFSTGYYVEETTCHDVVVAYGDGTSDRFKVSLSPERTALVPIQEVELNFTCETNPKVKLELVGNKSALLSGQTLYFYDESKFDLVKYKLTTEDGTVMYLDAKNGVSKMVTVNGTTIQVTEKGYESSDGKSIIFTRDEQKRVTKAEAPNGNTVIYSYDAAGNLASVTDYADRTVRFAYDKNHNLITITDPNGIATARNEYDETGRLIATIDADGNRVEYNYDIEGRTEAIKDAMGNTTVYTYDDKGNILQTIDAYGNKTVKAYDDNNNITQVTDALGNTTNYDYDKSGNVTSITNADGTTVKSTYTQENYVSSIGMLDKVLLAMDYDEDGNLTAVTDSEGNETEYAYDSEGQLTGITDAIGVYQKVTYDEEGNVATSTNGAGNTASYTYDSNGNCTSITIERDGEKGKETFTSYVTYDSAGNIVQSTDNAGNVTAFEYDANGNQTAVIDAKGRRTTYEYDDRANMTKASYSDGTFETFTYDANNNNITATDRTGLTVTMKYDKLGRMTAINYADGTKETYEYDAVGNVTTHTSVTGAKTTYAYDERYRNTAITDALGNTTQFEYDEASKLIKRIDAKKNETTYDYDAKGNIIKTTYADGTSISATYDARGRVIGQKDQYGNQTSYEYDGADRLVKVTDALENAYTYEYDANGNLVKVTDADEQITTYAYDANGRTSLVKNALGKTRTYTYDAMGNVMTYKDYAGNVTTYTYDKQDRMIEKKVNDAITTYEYDSNSRLSKVTDGTGSIIYTYDKYGRLVEKIDAAGAKLTYTYDEYGRLSKTGTEFGDTTYGYDLLDRVTRVIDRNGQATVYEYDEVGNRSVLTYANGMKVTYTYDPCQRLKEQWVTDKDGNSIRKYAYQLGKAGERIAITETADGQETKTTYEYDELLRLTKETITQKTATLSNEYIYDAVGNRISKTTTIDGDITTIADIESEEVNIVEGTTTYQYNGLHQLITEENNTGTITYQYDDNGNLVRQSGNQAATYEYNQENQLVRATVQSGNAVTIESYTYDYEGNRITKQVNENPATRYLVDTNGALAQIVAEVGESGEETAYYTRGLDLIGLARDGKQFYYVIDGHQSVRALTDEAGTITDTYEYDAYGNLLQKTGTTENDFRYTGEQYNANTGLYYLRARYMNPSTGTFISMDSYSGNIYEPVTLHKYLYANANPVMYTDPTGYFSLLETQVCMTMQENLQTIHNIQWLYKVMKWANAVITTYEVVTSVRNTILDGGSVIDVMFALTKGVVIGSLMECLSVGKLGLILKPMLAAIGAADQLDQLMSAIDSGDPEEIAYQIVKTAIFLYAATSQCFTGETLVATEDGEKRIDSIEEGDIIWAENTETGEKELCKVTEVFENETDTIVHVTLSDGEQVNTTEYHPFYVEGKGWCAASDLEKGYILRTATGEEIEVSHVDIEKLDSPVKVYNLEVEGLHTYYVGENKVLVHNKCEDKSNEDSFYIEDWSEYPDAPKPEGPFTLLEGEEYNYARKLANKINTSLHKQYSELDGLQIHEMHPVKFGGSPTDIDNKIALTPKEHAKYTAFWNKVLREMRGK